jgi:hypothetical protein
MWSQSDIQTHVDGVRTVSQKVNSGWIFPTYTTDNLLPELQNDNYGMFYGLFKIACS